METSRYNSKLNLKNLVFSLILIVFAGVTSASAVENEQYIPSMVKSVTVFVNQAQVTRIGKTAIQPGTTNLIFNQISPYININSLQVKTESNVTLMSVTSRNNYLQNNQKPTFVLELEDTLERINFQIYSNKIRKDALQLEKEVLLANKQIGGSNSGVKIEDLEDALTLYRKRSQEIGEEVYKIDLTVKKLQVLQSKFQSQLNEYNQNRERYMEIVVTIKSSNYIPQTAVELSYLVDNVSWTPFYDIRIKDTKSKLQLITKANIFQQTGEDWSNVSLTLSTANPTVGGNLPELYPAYLTYFTPVMHAPAERISIRGARMMKQKENSEGDAAEPLMYASGIAETKQGVANIEFIVNTPYSIPSDNKPSQVDLVTTELDAIYTYSVVPKLDNDVFVTAKVAGSDLINQINGEANVYFDGTFTGKSYINGTTNDTLVLTLGRDKRIQVKRTKLKELSSKSFFGSTKKEASTWEISVRNTRKETIALTIEDQIPVSNDKEIEVNTTDLGNAAYNATTGKLTWTLTLEPEKTQTVKFSFEVKYPKDKIITPY